MNKVYEFSGKNWKLASDKKWKESTSAAETSNDKLVGQRSVHGAVVNVYKTVDGKFYTQATLQA